MVDEKQARTVRPAVVINRDTATGRHEVIIYCPGTGGKVGAAFGCDTEEEARALRRIVCDLPLVRAFDYREQALRGELCTAKK